MRTTTIALLFCLVSCVGGSSPQQTGDGVQKTGSGGLIGTVADEIAALKAQLKANQDIALIKAENDAAILKAQIEIEKQAAVIREQNLRLELINKQDAGITGTGNVIKQNDLYGVGTNQAILLCGFVAVVCIFAWVSLRISTNNTTSSTAIKDAVVASASTQTAAITKMGTDVGEKIVGLRDAVLLDARERRERRNEGRNGRHQSLQPPDSTYHATSEA